MYLMKRASKDFHSECILKYDECVPSRENAMYWSIILLPILTTKSCHKLMFGLNWIQKTNQKINSHVKYIQCSLIIQFKTIFSFNPKINRFFIFRLFWFVFSNCLFFVCLCAAEFEFLFLESDQVYYLYTENQSM